MAAKKRKAGKKAKATKKVEHELGRFSEKNVVIGKLHRGPGRPSGQSLFRMVGERIPFDALGTVETAVKTQVKTAEGIYMAHDSMGCPRYAGRGQIFTRLASHKKAHPKELVYFSFYIVEQKGHEREVETLLIRGASYLLHFNERKKRVGLKPGNVGDYEPGTYFVEAQGIRGKKKKVKRS